MKKICLILFLPLLLIGCKNNTSANPEDVADSDSLTVEVEDSTLVNDSIVADAIPLQEEKAPEKVHVTVLREHKVIVEEIEINKRRYLYGTFFLYYVIRVFFIK